jgi:hypothetical protein
MTHLNLSTASVTPSTGLVYHWTCPGEDIAQDLEDLAVKLPAAAVTIAQVRALCLEFPADRISIEGDARRMVIRGPEELMARLGDMGLGSTGEWEEVYHDGLIELEVGDRALLECNI